MIRGNKQTKLRTERLYELYYYNSHPQGDGNPIEAVSKSRGVITTHTRKGMETSTVPQARSTVELQLTPARGWKRRNNGHTQKY